MKPGRRRILHVVHSLDPGGLENGVVNLANGMDAARFSVGICCLGEPGAFAGRLRDPENLTALHKGAGFSPGTALALARAVARWRPHLIHTHNLGPLIYAALATGGGWLRPILHGEHAELAGEDLSPRRLRQRRLCYRCCRAVHTVSETLRVQLAELGFPAAGLEAIRNGVDTARFLPGNLEEARRRFDLPREAVVLGMVARFGPYKRHALLLEAFEIAADRRPDLHLLFAGAGGPEEARVTARATASRHAARIRLVGLQADPVPVYQALDLLVIPSINEGLSNTLLEAMACARPVLAAPACGHAEVVTEGRDGFLDPMPGPGPLAARLLELLADRGRLVETGARARAKIEGQFGLDQMISHYEQLYAGLTHAGSRAGSF
jgi:glycosyltransferase involved in cell wall biosynthesis